MLPLLWSVALAQETLDVGVIRNDEIAVVQKNLYPKTKRTELGVHAGVMPFDAYLTTPNAQVSVDLHQSDRVGISILAGGGYGLKSGTYRELESITFGVAPYAFRYLGSALVGAEWAPIYAKMSWDGAHVVHFDVYGVGRAGLSVESSVIPGGGLAFAPTLSPGIGTRFFLNPKTSLRVELRDDLLLEWRDITSSMEFKQNAGVTAGVSFWSASKERR
jgi:outer membrane beta-barrel protein